ncbi:substrate-binding domain-containing protein [Chthonobacter rhizosphaerae]|uniref:substrate-binding domain-containing protein n=1 Tax=Chthonobacter rhizosphaerae TaxID=2735553 RepID=UPI001FE28AEE|nr:substrate-binding domain-containing protein [Chthonobacter rhizosphaerae]
MRRTKIIGALLAFGLSLSPASNAAANALTIVGTGDGLDMMRAVGALYLTSEGKEVVFPASIGSGGGIAAVAAETNALARVARPLKPTEMDAGLVAVPLASLRSAFIVHPDVGVTSLTSAQVGDIYAGRITDWADVGGKPLKIKVVRREDADSTLQGLRAGMPGWKDLVFTERSKVAVTTQDAVDTVRTVEGAIGFAPYSTSLLADTVVLKIDGRRPIDPGYPSAVELSLVYKKDNVTPEVTAFLEFARSDKARDLLSAYGAVPPPRSD